MTPIVTLQLYEVEPSILKLLMVADVIAAPASQPAKQAVSVPLATALVDVQTSVLTFPKGSVWNAPPKSPLHLSCNFLDGYVAVTAQNWFAPSRRRGRCVDNGRTTVIAYVYFSVLSAEQAPSAKPVSITERSMRPLFQS